MKTEQRSTWNLRPAHSLPLQAISNPIAAQLCGPFYEDGLGARVAPINQNHPAAGETSTQAARPIEKKDAHPEPPTWHLSDLQTIRTPSEVLDLNTPKATGNNNGKFKVLLVDDHPIMVEGMTEHINREADMTVCGQVNDAGPVMEAIEKFLPDVVVLDITLPHGHGLEVLKDIRSLYPDLPVLIFSMHDESVYAERVLRAGANGYLMKDEPPSRLLSSLRGVLQGELVFAPKLSSRLLKSLHTRRPQGSGAGGAECLGDRELEVLQFIGKGLSTREVATELRLSIKTVETYRARIKKKLFLKSANELVVYATRWVETGA
jgi:DNA-binding NarL/FixJ family response regulator